VPTNVGAEYLAAEEKYLKAKTTQEKIKWLKEMIRTCPKHKGTEKLLAQLNKRLIKLEKELEKEREKRASSKRSLFEVEKEGDALVSLVGVPNSGKSSIFFKLTGKEVNIADYPFSTFKPEIAMIDYEGSKVQLVDLPPITENAAEERGELFGVINNSDMVLIIIDLSQDVNKQLNTIFNEFKKAKIIIGKEKPKIEIKKKEKGGIVVSGLFKKEEEEQIRQLLRDYKIMNAEVKFKDNYSLKDLKFVLKGYKFIKALFVANKGDLKGSLENFQLLKEKIEELNKEINAKLEVIPVSAKLNKNIDLLKNKIWEKLELIRVFTKHPRKKEPDYPPITLKKGATIKDLVEKIHEEFLEKFNYAKVYGKSVKFQGQRVGLEHKLMDKDIVEIYLK
jgi:small GTP-binding protein